MNRIEKIVRTARPGAAVHLRAHGYGAGEEKDFLSDVLGLANSECEGGRLIVMGVAPTANGERQFSTAHPNGLDRPDYAALVNHYIEPALKVAYREINVEGAAVGVLHIQPCTDLPYLMRMDHCVDLRRGDGFTRVGSKAVRMGRSELERIYARKFGKTETKTAKQQAKRTIEIGFAGDSILKEWRVTTVDLSQRPSEVARGKIGQFMNSLESASGTGSTSVVQRLNHARIFGTEKPYEKRSRQQLMGDLADAGDDMWNEDQEYLFGRNGHNLDIVVLNGLEDSLLNVKFALSLPEVEGLLVANSGEPAPEGVPGHPIIESNSARHRISTARERLKEGKPMRMFSSPVRFCASDELVGKRLSVEYELSASNLDAPIVGRLQLSF